MVLSVTVAGSKAFPESAGRIAGMVAVTTGVFWLGHVYAHAMAYSVGHDQHLSRGALRRIARREASIIEAGVPSMAALVAGGLGLVSARVAVWAAITFGLAVLGVQGFNYARVERLSWPGTVAVVAANLAIGLVLIGLKLLVTH